MDLREKVVIVTRGGAGIGRATSLLLASHGAAVAVVYSRSEAEAGDTVGTIVAALVPFVLVALTGASPYCYI